MSRRAVAVIVVSLVLVGLLAASASAFVWAGSWFADERGGDRVVKFVGCSAEDDFGRIRLAWHGYLTGPSGRLIILTCVSPGISS